MIGAGNERAAVIEEVNKPFGIPIFKTDIYSAEMIKYASNAFLATKISFINEIANICEKVGANVEDVAYGMGLDTRIGPQFLRAGIGYGGSCFPKDTKALVQIAGDVDHQFELLEAVIKVNNKQQLKLVEKARSRFGSLSGKREWRCSGWHLSRIPMICARRLRLSLRGNCCKTAPQLRRMTPWRQKMPNGSSAMRWCMLHRWKKR